MTRLSKFGGSDLIASKEFSHPNIRELQDFGDWRRVAIGAREKEIRLILELAKKSPGPYGILYVLVASRLGRESARYQNPKPLDFDELELFLYTFQEFFEQDGRHHLWVMSLSSSDQFVFDQHNVIYAYGDVDRYLSQLESIGFNEGQVEVPVPHTHNYHQEFDLNEDELMEYWEWKMFPLQPGDDDS